MRQPTTKPIAAKAVPESAEACLARQTIAFDAILKLTDRFGTLSDVRTIASLFLMTLMGQLRLKRAAIYLSASERGACEPYHALGICGGDTLPRIAMDSPLVRWLSEAAEPVHLDEYFAAIGEAAGRDEEVMKRFVEVGFSHAAPFKERDRLLGLLFFSGKATDEPFSDLDRSMVAVLSRIAAIAMKNGWLYQAAVASKAELERFDEVKREFVNHASHELRTPLTVLKSALWSIEPEHVDGGIMLDMARDAVGRLQSRIEYLLSLNDVNLGGTAISVGPTDLSNLVDEILRDTIPELEEKRITLRLDDRAQGRLAMIDAPKIKMVVRSMIDNAVGSVAGGGTILVGLRVSREEPGRKDGIEIGGWGTESSERFDLRLLAGTSDDASVQEGGPPAPGASPVPGMQAKCDPSYIVLEIADNGVGIPPEEIQSLAQPFMRASNSAMRNVKGLGIGLSVAQKIVAGHAGKIFCRSALGEGAQFSVWLPLIV